jgi:hypothetical protein
MSGHTASTHNLWRGMARDGMTEQSDKPFHAPMFTRCLVRCQPHGSVDKGRTIDRSNHVFWFYKPKNITVGMVFKSFKFLILSERHAIESRQFQTFKSHFQWMRTTTVNSVRYSSPRCVLCCVSCNVRLTSPPPVTSRETRRERSSNQEKQ